MFFTAAGLIVGADALDLVDPTPSGETVKLLAEATLTLFLFADAARVDLRALRGELAVPTRLGRPRGWSPRRSATASWRG